MKKKDVKKEIIKTYVKVMRKKKSKPLVGDLSVLGVYRSKIVYHFGGFKQLDEAVKKQYPDLVKKLAAETAQEILSKEKKTSVLRSYTQLVSKSNMFPTKTDLLEVGVTRDIIRLYFGTMARLRKIAKEEYPEVFGHVLDAGKYFSKKHTDGLKESVKSYNKFIITTAVNGQWAHKGFLKSMETYCKKNKAKLLILPSHDPAHNLDNEVEWAFDSAVENDSLVFTQLKLNDRIHLSDLRVTAKQMNPTTGLGRVTKGKGSFIFGSPKQSLEYDPAAVDKRYPHARMTTGACTMSNYSTTKGNSFRTAFLADYTHVMGALIVEIKDNKQYNFRQIQCDEDGTFVDLGAEYKGTKTRKLKPSEMTLILGDSHAGEHDLVKMEAQKKFIKELKVGRLIFHDLFNGASINHHEDHNIIQKARRANNNEISLEKELKVTADYLKEFLKEKNVTEAVVVRSNHDDFISRWLAEAKFSKDPTNFQLGCRLADAYLNGEAPLPTGLAIADESLDMDKMIFLGRHDSFKIGGIECGSHGDKGSNGSRGSIKGMERALGPCNIGHSHTAGIHHSVFQCGTSSLLRLGYNVGPSTWMHADIIQYENGQRQIVNFINGEYKL